MLSLSDIFNLTIPSNFGMDEEGEKTEAFYDVINQLPENTEIKTGASKFVIFLNDSEVIKIPFNGEYYYDEEEDYEKFDYFCNEDYCMIEASIYSDAIVAGVERFFASTKFAGSTFIDKTPVYVSERVIPFDTLNNEERSYSRDSYTKAGKMCGPTPTEWTAMALEFYGEEAVKKLFDFIEEEGIDDLHWGNVGLRKDGSPCLLDYSGFDS